METPFAGNRTSGCALHQFLRVVHYRRFAGVRLTARARAGIDASQAGWQAAGKPSAVRSGLSVCPWFGGVPANKRCGPGVRHSELPPAATRGTGRDGCSSTVCRTERAGPKAGSGSNTVPGREYFADRPARAADHASGTSCARARRTGRGTAFPPGHAANDGLPPAEWLARSAGRASPGRRGSHGTASRRAAVENAGVRSGLAGTDANGVRSATASSSTCNSAGSAVRSATASSSTRDSAGSAIHSPTAINGACFAGNAVRSANASSTRDSAGSAIHSPTANNGACFAANGVRSTTASSSTRDSAGSAVRSPTANNGACFAANGVRSATASSTRDSAGSAIHSLTATDGACFAANGVRSATASSTRDSAGSAIHSLTANDGACFAANGVRSATANNTSDSATNGVRSGTASTTRADAHGHRRQP